MSSFRYFLYFIGDAFQLFSISQSTRKHWNKQEYWYKMSYNMSRFVVVSWLHFLKSIQGKSKKHLTLKLNSFVKNEATLRWISIFFCYGIKNPKYESTHQNIKIHHWNLYRNSWRSQVSCQKGMDNIILPWNFEGGRRALNH